MKPAIAPKRGRCLSARDAAQYLGLSERQVRHLIARGELPALRHTSGRLLGVYEVDLDGFLAARVKRDGQPASAPASDIDERLAAHPAPRLFHWRKRS